MELIWALVELFYVQLLGGLVWMLLWLVLLPVWFVIATPFVLGMAAFRPGNFSDNVHGSYSAIWHSVRRMSPAGGAR
ncbi:MAG: hypothetical protein KDC87_10175 [Planctomycetes bacterium]|nr:hypothetical protein [Planctomycetota bacterium]MCB9868410.1 hypothetical protein [Planctomycetota bacterium]